MNKETWARFVAHEPVDLGNLAPDIADSWYKCAQSNINPYQAKATLVWIIGNWPRNKNKIFSKNLRRLFKP
ncbi:hypothetical protein [Agrilactobacillus composti]|uniref:hypothetical protein n=1 Tax=Agrilactobacillus composti TaxID=398555 RepID=UPI00068B2BDA|nr:hypothetical protein [Agrilactobacillus composti]